MAETKLEIERRADRLEATVERLEVTVERLENAVGTMASWLVSAQTGFGTKDAEGIMKILRGEDTSETMESSP